MWARRSVAFTLLVWCQLCVRAFEVVRPAVPCPLVHRVVRVAVRVAGTAVVQAVDEIHVLVPAPVTSAKTHKRWSHALNGHPIRFEAHRLSPTNTHVLPRGR
eukprot:3653324-Prymnesium_polylepis.1